MDQQTNKILIKIGKSFEATATGTVAVLLLFAIVVMLTAIGFNFK